MNLFICENEAAAPPERERVVFVVGWRKRIFMGIQTLTMMIYSLNKTKQY
jgi:hypothetical protein